MASFFYVSKFAKSESVVEHGESYLSKERGLWSYTALKGEHFMEDWYMVLYRYSAHNIHLDHFFGR